MTRAIYYPKANRTAQWFSNDWASVIFSSVRAVVLHTTETSGWPGYDGGGSAPNLTAYPDPINKRLLWRHHFGLNESSRALKNLGGGVNTNTTNVVQVELIGTCDRGGPGLYWPTAPDWALAGIADFLSFMRDEWGVPLSSNVRWISYPDSYGTSNGVRLSGSSWLAYRGVLGHQHVAENDHGDPGNINIGRILEIAKGDDSMSAEDVAALKTYIDSKIDDIAAAVWTAKVQSRWTGQPVTTGGTLTSTHFYSVQGGFGGDTPDTATTSPGSPTMAAQLLSQTDTVETVLGDVQDQLAKLVSTVALAVVAELRKTGVDGVTVDQVREVLVDVLAATRLTAPPA